LNFIILNLQLHCWLIKYGDITPIGPFVAFPAIKLFPNLSAPVCKKQRLSSTALDTVINPCQEVFFFSFNEFVAPEPMKAADGVKQFEIDIKPVERV